MRVGVIAYFVSRGENLPRDLGKAPDVSAAHEKGSADTVLGELPQNGGGGFAGPVVKGESQNASRPVAAMNRRREKCGGAASDGVGKAKARYEHKINELKKMESLERERRQRPIYFT